MRVTNVSCCRPAQRDRVGDGCKVVSSYRAAAGGNKKGRCTEVLRSPERVRNLDFSNYFSWRVQQTASSSVWPGSVEFYFCSNIPAAQPKGQQQNRVYSLLRSPAGRVCAAESSEIIHTTGDCRVITVQEKKDLGQSQVPTRERFSRLARSRK